MLRLAAAPTFWRTVSAKVPSETEPDTFDDVTFRVLFEALHEDEAKTMDEAYEQLSDDDKHAQRWRVLRRVVRGWEDVADAAGEPVPFSPAALDQALGWPWVGPAMMLAWRGALAGEKPRLGN